MPNNSTREEIIVSEHLEELRGRVRLLTWISGLSWTVLVLFGGLLVTGCLDWMIHFDDPGLRLVIGIALLTASSVMAWRQLIRPLIQPLTTSFLALRIEQRFPGLRSRVLSAVEFLQHRMDSRVGSPEMQQAVVQSALQDLERIEPADIVETRAVKRVTIAGAILCVMIATVVIVHPLEASTALKRLMFPFANCPWPRQFELTLVRADMSPVTLAPEQPLMIARGDTLELYVVDRRSRLPERVWFEHRTNSTQPIEREPLRQTTLRDAKGHSRQAAVISWVASRGELQFRATGGDDETMSFLTVEVVEPPTLESLRVTVSPPKYSGRPVESLPQGVGHVQGLLGTTVDVVASADKPLRSARLRIADKAPVDLKVSDDQLSFTASFPISDSGVTGYWFELTDQAGFSDPEAPRFELRGIADAVPEVIIESPVADIMLAPDAELPIKVLAKDDLGLREVRLSGQINDNPTPLQIPLAAAGDSQSPLLLSTPEYVWNLAELALAPGNRIVFRAEATDDYDLGEAHVGKSTPRTITITSKEDKQRELAGRVGDLLEDLQQATTLQQRARQQTSELQTQLNTAGELRMQDIDQLHRIEMDQRQAASRLNRPADGVQSAARALQDEFRTNKLEDSETQRRLNQIVEELSRLDREQFPEIESALTRAAKQADDQIRTSKPSSETREPSDSRDDQRRDSTKPGTTTKPEDTTSTETKEPKQPPGDAPKPEPGDQAPKSDRSALETALGDAQSHQSRALETLQELQELLSEWRDQRDVSKELNSLITEQEQIQKDAAALGQETVSKSNDELSPQQKADLAKMSDRQRKIANQVENFRKQLENAAKTLKQRDPETANRFNDARDELSNDGTANRLEQVAEDILNNKMGSASEGQQQALQDLKDLDKQMKREPTDDLETLVKQIEQAVQEFDTLRKQQLDLKEQLRKAADQQDPQQQSEQLQQLREKQQELGDKLAEAERRLERLRLRQPTEAAQRAQDRLDRLNKQLEDPEQADDAGEQMQQIADDLEQVERELSLEKRIAQERLAMEELEKIEDKLKALQSQQQSVIAETERLESERDDQGLLSRAKLRTLLDLSEVERGLQSDAEQMEKSLKVAEVFSLVLRRVSRSLKLASDQLAQKETGAAVIALEKDALKKIENLLMVLKPEPPPESQPQQSPDGTKPEEQPDKPQQAGPPGESLPQIAQLKLLKSLQEEYLERTQLLDKLRDAKGNLPLAAAEELDELAREQAELADLTRDMIAKIMQSRPDPEDEAKARQKANDEKADEKDPPVKLDLDGGDNPSLDDQSSRKRKGESR